MARAIARGWIEAHGPAFESGREIDRTAGEVHRIGATAGFRELGSPGDLRGRCAAAHRRWIAYREGAIGRGTVIRTETTVREGGGSASLHHAGRPI